MKKWLIILISVIVIIIVALLILFFVFKYHLFQNPYSGNALPITEEELKCGVYFGDYNDKKPGTPDNWILVLSGTRSAQWKDPNTENTPYDC